MIWVMDSIPWVRCASGNVFLWHVWPFFAENFRQIHGKNSNVQGGRGGSSRQGQIPNFYRKFVAGAPVSDEGYAKLRDQVTIKRRRWEPLTYSHFLYSLRLIIWQDGKKPGLIDWTQRFWEISCSVCFLQVMRLIREGGIIMNSLGSFPAPGAKVAAAKIFLGKYNRGLVPMSIHSSFALSEPIFVNLIEIWDARQLEMRMSDRCAGIKNPSDFFPICQRSLPIQEWHKMWSRFAPQICHFFGS